MSIFKGTLEILRSASSTSVVFLWNCVFTTELRRPIEASCSSQTILFSSLILTLRICRCLSEEETSKAPVLQIIFQAKRTSKSELIQVLDWHDVTQNNLTFVTPKPALAMYNSVLSLSRWCPGKNRVLFAEL